MSTTIIGVAQTCTWKQLFQTQEPGSAARRRIEKEKMYSHDGLGCELSMSTLEKVSLLGPDTGQERE